MLFGLYRAGFKVAFEETLWRGYYICVLCLLIFAAHHFAVVHKS